MEMEMEMRGDVFLRVDAKAAVIACYGCDVQQRFLGGML